MARAARMQVCPAVRVLYGVLCFLLLAIATVAGAAQTAERVPRALILYPFDERIPGTTIAGKSARKRLLEATGKIDLYSEFLDLSRFPEKVHVDRMARYLAGSTPTAVRMSSSRSAKTPSALLSPIVVQ